MDLWEIEKRKRSLGYKIICGVDEAGRGPLAGPVYAAAVVLPYKVQISGLNDSKKLSESKREKLYDEIIEKALAYNIASATNIEIDELNILQATYLAMNRAIKGVAEKYDGLSFITLIDGNRNEGIRYNNECVIGGDGKSASIAAASILAKVSRDRYMIKIAQEYPEYRFERHKGYGTKLHYEKLLQFGPSKIHRSTFLKKLNFTDALNVLHANYDNKTTNSTNTTNTKNTKSTKRATHN